MKIKLLILSGALIASASLFAVTGEEALEKFRARMAGIGVMSGTISWTSPSGFIYTGHFNYMAPDKIHIKFSNPGGKTIVSNGKKLWVYDSGSNICGIQDLGSSRSGGIAALTSGYSAIASGQGGGYMLKLQNPEKHYSEITITTDESFTLRRAVLKSKEGTISAFTLSNLNTSPNIVRTIFDFKVPSNAQSINNPLDIR